MKTGARVFIAGTLILLMAFGIWNGALAEKNSTRASLRNVFLSRLSQGDTRSAGLKTETPQAAEDNQSRQEDDNSQATISREPGDDSQAAHESASTPEPGNDSQHVNASADIQGASSEVTGIVTATHGNTITVNGTAYNITTASEVASALKVGDTAILELAANNDGSLSLREIKVTIHANGVDESSQSRNDQGGSSGSDDPGRHHGGSGNGGCSGGGGGDGGSGG